MADSLNNTTFSNATVKKKTSLEFAYIYASVGTVGMLTNIFILAVLMSDRKFLKRSANIAGVAIGHLLCAISIGGTGFYRIVNYEIILEQATAWSCIARIYPAMFPFAFQSMGAMLALIGTERFSVFVFPHWYRIKWTTGRGWRMVGLVYVCVTASFMIDLLAYVWDAPVVTLSCSYSSIFGQHYTVYISVVSAVGGTTAVTLTLLGLIRGSMRVRKLPLLSGEAGRYQRQLKLTRSMLSIAVCDFFLVVIPNIIFILFVIDSSMLPRVLGGNLSNYTNVTYCVNAVLSIGTYLAFHRKFRERAVKFLRLDKTLLTRVTQIKNK